MNTVDKYNINMAEFFKNLKERDYLGAEPENGFAGERAEEEPKTVGSRKEIDKEHKEFLDAVGEFIRSIDINSL